MKLIPFNPARDVAKPKGPKREMIFLDDGQARAVRLAARGHPGEVLVVAAMGTGCRQGELLALGWDDIDLTGRRLTIGKCLSWTKAGGFALKEPKTETSRRTLALPGFAVAVLAEHRRAAVESGRLNASVFCTRDGGYLDKKNVLRSFRSVVKRANKSAARDGDGGAKPIPEKIRFHDIRHSVASLLLSGGHSLKAVSVRLGHANPTMTLRVYAHCLPNDDGRLADGLESTIG